MNSRVLILVVVTLVVVAIVWPLLFPTDKPPTVITHIEATQDIEPGAIITADVVKEVRVKMVEGEEVEVEEEEALPSVAEAGSTKLDQVVGTIATERIEKGKRITSETVPLSPWSAALYLGKEVISFYAEIDEALGGILKLGDIIDIYAYHPVQEDEATQLVKISPCILVVDSHGTSGNPARWPISEAAQGGAGSSILGGGGGAVERVVPASIVTVAVDPNIAWRIIEVLGSRGFRTWVTLSHESCWMPPSTPIPTLTSTPTSTPTPGPMPDLVIEDITTDPDPMVVDQLGTVRVEVKNQGPAEMDANKCWVGLYIDRPAEGDPDEQMFCPPLVDGSAIISYTVALADEGYHALTAWADWLEAIPEEAEVNNQASASIRVVRPTPTPTPPLVPALQVAPTTLIFSAERYGAPALPQEVSIDNAGEGALEWKATKDADWLNVNPTSGLAPSTIVVSADTTGLLPDTTYEGRITIEAGRGTQHSPQTITAVLVVPPTPPPDDSSATTDVIKTDVIHLIFNQWWLETIEVVDLEGRPVDLELKPLSGEGIYYADYYGRGFEMTVKNNREDMHIWIEDENVGADVFIDGDKLDAWEKIPIGQDKERTIKVQLRDGFNQATVVLVDD